MRVYKPSDLQAFLKSQGLHAKKGLSQNFLIDGNIIQKIVSAANVAPGDHVIEVGPGPGALTQALLDQGAHVLALELDPVFAAALKRLQTDDKRLDVRQVDVLKFPLLEELQKDKGRKWKLIANLPYHITTPILTLFLPLSDYLDSLTVMVQKEFAVRMTAKAGTSEYSSFTLFLQFYSKVDQSFTVKPTSFYPRPKVHSSVVHCKLHPPLLLDAEPFFQLTRTAFGKRRKMLRTSLKDLYEAANVEKALLHLGHSSKARPEELTLEEFLALYDFLRCAK